MNREEYLSLAHCNAKRGNELPHAKLNPDLVCKIRADYKPFSRTHGAPALAKRHGIHQRTVEKVLSHETWCHV